MPRKTKDQSELKETKKDTKETVKKASTKKTAASKAKSTSTKKATTAKKTTTKKKVATTDAKPKKASTKSKTTTVKKEPKTEVKTVKKKSSVKAKAEPKKSTTTKKAPAKKATTAKKTSTTKKKTATTKTPAKKKTVAKKSKLEVVEYYDLPYRYNQTIVKLLAQTPTTLFVYWDISDEDRKNFEEKYGENFFQNTKPVLIVHNDTLNYSFEVEINDFANSWYLHVSDSKCDYRIELGRRPFEKEKFEQDYFYVSNSNELESPNDKILFDSIGDRVFFRDVKTGIETSKSIYNISLLKNMGKIYNIYDLYKAIYKNENVENIYDLYNPSSGNPSSY